MKIWRISQLDHIDHIDQPNKIVSFDFDDTIFTIDRDAEDFNMAISDPENPSYASGHVNESIASLIRKYKSDGWKVICVTSRISQYRKQVEDVISKNGLPIEEIYCTEGRDKVFKLKDLGVSIHYDDDPFEISALKGSGIEGIRV